MQQYKVLIADDEPIARDILAEYISKLPAMQVVASCKNAIEVLNVLSKETVDILLLDINMPEITGIDLLRTLKNPPIVIFTTAYAQYAVESYELNAIDYLLKPFSLDRFVKAIHKATDLLEKKEEKTTAEDTTQALFVKSDGKLVKIEPTALVMIEGVKDYVKLWMQDSSLLVHTTMKNMEEQLAAYGYMLRVHKSYIINLSHVQEVDGNVLRVGKHTVVVGSTYKDKLLETLKKYRLIS